MGTDVYDEHGIQVRRFYGGIDRGTCYQIRIVKEYIQMTEDEFERFLLICKRYFQ